MTRQIKRASRKAGSLKDYVEIAELRFKTKEETMMKRIMLFAAAIAALAACSKETETLVDASHFEKGQKVTFTVKAGEPSTRVISELNTGTGTIDFKWQTGDKIKVKVGTEHAEFTLVSGAGTSSASFTGTMPAGGSAFDVQYPATDPVLTTQAYSSTEAIPHDMMKFAATGCSTSSPTFTLAPQYAALRLNLYGGARSVSQIVVSNTGTSDTYTLTCSPAKVVGKDKDSATPFFIVVPVGTGSWNFSAAVTATEVTSTSDNTASYESYGLGTVFSFASTTFTPAKAQEITAGGILNMPAKSLTTVWAPVNCGYSSTYTYGLLYQWGRKYGQAYEDVTITPTSMTKAADTAANSGQFGLYNDTDYNWFSGGVDNTLWNESGKGGSDPCPTGWRVPTVVELGSLFFTDWDSSSHSGSTKRGSWNSTAKGWDFGDVFLPAAGCRYYDDGDAYDRGDYGNYWSSSVYGDNAWYLGFDGGDAGVSKRSRAIGYSVRCVQE